MTNRERVLHALRDGAWHNVMSDTFMNALAPAGQDDLGVVRWTMIQVGCALEIGAMLNKELQMDKRPNNEGAVWVRLAQPQGPES